MRRLLFAPLLVACTTAAAGGEPTSQTRGAVQGATDTKSAFAVAILDDTEGICSGTLIAPNLVLTARHCVAEGGGDPVNCATDRFEAPRAAAAFRVSAKATATYEAAEYKVTNVLVPSDSLFCGNDLALAIIDANVSGVTAEPSLELPDVDAITAIGYGISEPGANDDGTRRKLAAVDVVCVPGIPKRDCNLSTYDMAKTELAAGNGLCEGDSGSGGFVPSSLASGKPIVVGVLSRAADDGATCIDAVYARTDAFKAFLVDGATQASKAGGYPLPSWAMPASTEPGEVEPGDESEPVAPADDGSATTEATPAPVTTTTAAGCAAAPAGIHGKSWWFIVLLLPFIKRRTWSHSRV